MNFPIFWIAFCYFSHTCFSNSESDRPYISFNFGKSFLSSEKGSENAPIELLKGSKIGHEFPFAIMVSKGSYLEVESCKYFQFRAGQSTIFEMLSFKDINLFQGSLLICQLKESVWNVSTKMFSLGINGMGTWMLEKTSNGNLKIILLEGKGTLQIANNTLKLESGDLVITQNEGSTFSQILKIDLPLILATSKLINNFQTELASYPKLVSAAKVQSLRLKKRFEALVGDTTDLEKIRLWAIKKENNRKK